MARGEILGGGVSSGGRRMLGESPIVERLYTMQKLNPSILELQVGTLKDALDSFVNFELNQEGTLSPVRKVLKMPGWYSP